MSARTLDAHDPAPYDFDNGRLGRLTWLGLLVAAIGWSLLLSAAVLLQRLGAKVGIADPAGLHADLVEVSRCLIGSGFALALIGALQTGFGALNRFFSAVLTRSTPRAVPANAEATPMAPPPVDRSAEPLRERRPFQIMADGSVEVETIVGTRRFETMHEAREFI